MQNLKNIGEVTTGLADNLRRLGIMAAWYWQNKIKNYSGKVSFLKNFPIFSKINCSFNLDLSFIQFYLVRNLEKIIIEISAISTKV